MKNSSMIKTGAELERFMDSEFPQWNESWITTGFEFDIKRLGDIEGIIEPDPMVSFKLKRIFKVQSRKYFMLNSTRFGGHQPILP